MKIRFTGECLDVEEQLRSKRHPVRDVPFSCSSLSLSLSMHFLQREVQGEQEKSPQVYEGVINGKSDPSR